MLEQYFGLQSSDVVPTGSRHVQWVTLFDHPDDDVYDGILGEDDDEVPRVKIEFHIEEAKAQASNTAEINIPKIIKQ